MKRWKIHIEQWLGSMLMLLLMLASCTSSDTSEEPEKPKEKPVLKIYIFAPERPIVTRADNGNVKATDEEKAIHTLDVWVFEHESPYKKVTYTHLDNLSFDGQKEVTMELSDEFANYSQKPRVDIFVAANKESCGVTLNENASRDDVMAVCIGSNYFGVSSPVSSVPTDGLPMSGWLEQQPVDGIPPVFSAMRNNVKLVRAVSKVRFVFSQSSVGPPTISDLSITLNEGMIPKEEYLFLEGDYPIYLSHVKTGSGYEAATTLVTGKGSNDINSCANPGSYLYTTETGQEYETKINNGLTDPDAEEELKPDLSELGCFYFHESDQKLTGTISYKLGPEGNQTQKSVDFEMATAGDFTRNHTWIVYGYFLGSGELKLNVVDVKGWTEDTSNPIVYNW